MVDIPIATRSPPAGLDRTTLRPAAPAAMSESPTGVSGNARSEGRPPAQLSMSPLGEFKSAVLEFRNAAATLTVLAKMLVLKSPFTTVAPEAVGKPASGATPSSTMLDGLNRTDPPASPLPTITVGGVALSAAATALLRAVQAFVAAHNQWVATQNSNLTDAAAGEATLDHMSGDAGSRSLSGRAGVASVTVNDPPGTPAAVSRTVLSNAILPMGERERAAPLARVGDGKTSGLIGNNTAPTAADQAARRLLNGLTATVSRWPGLPEIGLTLGRAGGLRLDSNQLQAALAVRPQTVAKLFNEWASAADEATPLLPSTAARPSVATVSPPPVLFPAALAELREKAQVLTSLARLLADSAPPATRPQPVSAGITQSAPTATQSVLPEIIAAATKPAILNSGADASPALETLYLHRQETLLSTALPRPDIRLTALTIQMQAGHDDAATGRFVADPRQPPVSVTANIEGDTLSSLRTALHAGEPELGAAVVKDGVGYRLAVRLPEEAAIHTVAVSLGKAPRSAALSEGQALGFTVQRDADAVPKAVQSFVSAYNRLSSAAASMMGDPQTQTLAGSLRQALVGAMMSPERIRALAQAGVTMQRDGSLLIDPVRLRKAAEAHPRRLLEPFSDRGGDDGREAADPSPAAPDAFADWLADLGDEQEAWGRRLEDHPQKPALNPDGGRHANGGLDVVAARCRARLETVEQVTRQVLSTGMRLKQELARLAGESSTTI
ncbi:MAG: hypothetical protein EKK68_06240 [Candidatus Competibacteraceae bacterium]|nr:MAG: hypothetical protein EKK68_06240 [Candidatus Competibacteraceae bacterium]